MNLLHVHPLDIINAVICGALVVHGVCIINHFDRLTPCLMRLGITFFTVGCAGVAIGPFYGVVTTDPLEVLMNAGLLLYAMRKELFIFMTNRKSRHHETAS